MRIIILLSICTFFFSTCKKNNDNSPNSNFWKVKYEVTCSNSSTQVCVIFRDESGGVQQVGSPTNPSVTYKKVPWTYEANFSKDPGLIASRSLSLIVFDAYLFNSTNQITAKIYVNGNVVNQSSSAGVFGIFITYVLN